MRGRTAALAIAGVLLLGGMALLRCAMSDDEAPTSAPSATTPPPPAPIATAPAPAPSPPPSAAPPPVAAPVHAPAGAAPSSPELPEIVQSFVPAEKHPPIANKALLREQVAAVQAEVAECGKQAGSAANGTAVLTYMVTPEKQKQDVVIEQVGVEYDGTTITDQPLLDCLKDTSKDMKFKYVPDTDGVFALRRVKLADGKVVENAFMDFHYVR